MSVIPQLIANSLIAAGTYALTAIGFNLIYGTTKFFNLAHGVMAAIGGYIVFALVGHVTGVPIFLDVVIAIVATGLIALGVDRLVYLPLRNRKASNMVLLVASLGVFTIIQAVLAMIFTSQFQTLSSSVDGGVLQIMGAAITTTQLTILGSALGVWALISLLLKFTLFGKEIRAVNDDAEVAKIAGINVEKIIAWTFVLGSSAAGLAGVLIGFDTGIEPTMGLNLLLKGVIAAIVGGIGSVSGAILGAVLLGFAENFGIWKISGEWKDSIAFVLLIIFLIFRPRGIVNK